jgi:sugar lactone lactonase YvrE
MIQTISLNSDFEKLLPQDPGAEKIATGFGFTEGPVWSSGEACLIFSDIPGNTVYRWSEGAGHTVLRKPSGNTNGNTLDPEGLLVSCEHSGRRVSRRAKDGTVETVVSHFEGKRLNSPNDIICSSEGDLVFTDPPYGLRQADGSFAGQEIDFSGVYRVVRNGDIRLLVDDFVRPNGLLFDHGEKRLFVNDTDHNHVRVFEITPDGSLSGGRVFAELRYGEILGHADGMKMDSEGNIYVAGNTPEGVWVFSPEGELIGLIGVGEGPANLAWGGDGWRTLFVTARTSVYRISMRVAGMPVGGN